MTIRVVRALRFPVDYVNAKAVACKCKVAVAVGRDRHPRGQPAILECALEFRYGLWLEIDEGGGEHVASDSTDRIEVKMHPRDLRG